MTVPDEGRGSGYFHRVGTEQGLNGLAWHPCELLDFAAIRLAPGTELEHQLADREALLVLLSGSLVVTIQPGGEWSLGPRPSPFSAKPWAAYLPAGSRWRVTVPPTSPAPGEAALCSAPARLQTDPYIIRPEHIVTGHWGSANFKRRYHSILVGEGRPVERLIVGETFTPSGNWSTYPPHRHEVDDPPREVVMEEMYYFRVDPPDGFGLTRLYTDSRDLDEVYLVEDETLLAIPRGYHTVVSAPGYTTYYLWFLAGDTRLQAVQLDPALAWVQRTVPMLES